MLLTKQESSEPSERLVGLSDDVGVGFISGHSSQAVSASELNAEKSIDLRSADETGNMGTSKVIRVDQKRFFFDLGNNNRGHFLRISEVHTTEFWNTLQAITERISVVFPPFFTL